MAPKDDRTPPVSPSPAAPRPGRPVPADTPPAPRRPPARKIVVSGRLLDNLRRTCAGSGELHLLVCEVLAAIDDQRIARSRNTDKDGVRLSAIRGGPPPSLPPVWISSLSTTRNPDGSIEVVINGAWLSLKPHLAALFIALAEDSGVAEDEGVGFKTLDELALRMAKLTGGRILPGTTVNKYIHKLRQKFLDIAELPSDVIQSRYPLLRRLAVTSGALLKGWHDGPQATWPSSRASAASVER
jgi:hypothetical protein